MFIQLKQFTYTLAPWHQNKPGIIRIIGEQQTAQGEVPYQPGNREGVYPKRTLGVLLFNGQFQFNPAPDDTYQPPGERAAGYP